ncbi:MFS transporter [Nocardia sp. SYP-A9097]|uniref:MFS transporter n=1 Tax=Nocardia sp. SYP-A9097 TaxID=2663237 RepID=UPI00129B7A6A|nr:MFS transporter [Nocardia sp. SYP-A9097]MRH93626.1 MFS transporter [Nocardia sp. SYP-A9097]
MAIHDDAELLQPQVAGGQDPRRWWALAVIVLAQLIVVLDTSIMTISLPFAQSDLNISDGDKQWVFTAYTLVFGGLLLLGGRLADYMGRRTVFIAGLVGFAIASAGAGLAQSGWELFAGRALQGAFAALLAPAALALVSTTFSDPGERAKAFGAYAGVSGAGAAIGLIAGGVLTEYANWRWCLLVNTPIAILAAVAAAVLVAKDIPAPREGGYDVPGAVTATLGLVAIVYGFSRAAESGWGAGSTIALFAVGAVLLAAFVAIESRVSNPLLPLRIPGEINRGGAFLAGLLVPAAMLGMFIFLSYYFQIQLGYSPLKAGLALLPLAGGILISAGVTSGVLPKSGPRPVMLAGALLGTVGLIYLAQLDMGADYWANLFPPMFLIALGMGPLFVGMQATALHRVEEKDLGVASALLAAGNQIGGAIGTALLTTIAVRSATQYARAHSDLTEIATRAAIHSYDVVFYWGAGFFVAVGLVAALMLRDNKSMIAPAADTEEQLSSNTEGSVIASI